MKGPGESFEVSKVVLTARDLSPVSPVSSPHLVLHGLVDPVDQPGERLPIDGFGQGVSGIDGVIDGEWAEDLFRETKLKLNFSTVRTVFLKTQANDQ